MRDLPLYSCIAWKTQTNLHINYYSNASRSCGIISSHLNSLRIPAVRRYSESLTDANSYRYESFSVSIKRYNSSFSANTFPIWWSRKCTQHHRSSCIIIYLQCGDKPSPFSLFPTASHCRFRDSLRFSFPPLFSLSSLSSTARDVYAR